MKKLIIAGMMALCTTGALAHSPLDQTTPAHEATVAEVPIDVLMEFKGDIRLTRVTMTHAGAHSVAMDLGTQTTFRQDYSMPLEDMGTGEYLIEWRGLGSDGHALNGSFSFVVE